MWSCLTFKSEVQMGLFDRDYMRGGGNSAVPPRSNNDWRSMFWLLVGINAFTFIFLTRPHSRFHDDLALAGDAPWFFQLFQLVTAAFMHASITHILFNMYGLYLFGNLVGPHLGGKKFLALYLISAVAGNLAFLLFNYGKPTMIVGASGAVFGMMIAAACLEPERRFVMLFLPMLPLKTVTMVIGYAIIEVLLQIFEPNDRISHLAHLGGLVGGYLYIKCLFRNTLPWDPLRHRLRPGEERPFHEPPHAAAGDPERPVTGTELDALLDKVSRFGINSLSEYELARLRKAREQMRGK